MPDEQHQMESPTGERQLAEVALRRSLLGVARALAAQLSVEGACSVALDTVKEVFGATSAWIMLHDAQNSALRTVLFRGVGSDVYNDLSIPTSAPSIATRVFNGRAGVFVPDVRAEQHWFQPDRMYRSGLRSLFMLPLVFGPRTLGIIALDAPRFTRTNPPGSDDIEQLEAFAAQIAIAVTNARGSCRIARCGASARHGRSRSTCVSLPRPIRIWKPPSPTNASGRICTIV